MLERSVRPFLVNKLLIDKILTDESPHRRKSNGYCNEK